MLKRKGGEVGIVRVFGRILAIAIVGMALMLTLQIWGINIAPLIAFGGIGAAAVGFAAKDVISNFFGGLMIQITHPFAVGDMVLLPEKNLEGTVEEIGWYLTVVRDKEKRPVYLPNALFSSLLVVNSARMTHRRIEETVGIRYQDFSNLSVLKERIEQAIRAHSDIARDLPIIVVLKCLGSYSLDLYIDVYTKRTRYEEYLHVKEEILVRVYEELQKVGAQVASPTLLVR
ncbi:MAG: mechanosensitive ion channel family protein [Verrucomicrobia bacterium]|nr:mechanosensitive ion channel family protein [Verrucomicrobiota bacterium]